MRSAVVCYGGPNGSNSFTIGSSQTGSAINLYDECLIPRHPAIQKPGVLLINQTTYMKITCNNDLVMATQSAASFAAFLKEISGVCDTHILTESMDTKGCFLHLYFLSEGSFPLERFHELTRRLNDLTLEIHVISLCQTSMQPLIRYEYKEGIWIWQEDKGRTTIAVPDDLRCPGIPS